MRKLIARLTPLIAEENSMNNIRATAINALLLAALCLPLSGCAKTVGQEFREIMADIDAQCRKDKMGPYLDKDDPEYFEKRAQTDCDILTLKPADPLATEEGRFAYSIKLPAPHDKPMVQYRKGMSAESYFKQLCEKVEGDFVFRTVDGVDGIKIMRPQPPITKHPLWEEYGWLSPGRLVAHVNGIYDYVDAVELTDGTKTDTKLVRYFVDPKLSPRVPPWGLGHSPIRKSETRYGFTFRNSPLENRELGIVGQELIILDLQSNEILAFRRRFTQLNFTYRNMPLPMGGVPCRMIELEDNRFIEKILKPAAKNVGDKK